MGRRNGSVKSAQRDMLFSRIGKPIPRFVAPESIDVIVVPFSQGNFIYPFANIIYISGAYVEEIN